MAKRFVLTGMGIASLGVAIPLVADVPRVLIWNASASVPVGLYWIKRRAIFARGDLVAVMPPDDLARFMASRGYLPSGVPLIKAIAALPGQEVCREGVTISVDGAAVAEALERDRQGRDLPRWTGCHRIAGDEFFLLNADIRDSLDGRYFGPTPASGVIGKAFPIYTKGDDDDVFRWSGEPRRLFRVLLLSLALAITLPMTACAQSLRSGSASTSSPFALHVAEASHRFGIPEGWINAVMRVESAGKPRAISAKGAMGLMQIMPSTWAGLRARHGLGADPHDPRDNILAGAAYLRELHERYGSPGFLAAYNAGPGRYEEHRAKGRPLPAETRAYVARITPLLANEASPEHIQIALPPTRAWRHAKLFAAQGERDSDAPPMHPAMLPEYRKPASPVRDLSGIMPVASGLFVARAGAETSR